MRAMPREDDGHSPQSEPLVSPSGSAEGAAAPPAACIDAMLMSAMCKASGIHIPRPLLADARTHVRGMRWHFVLGFFSMLVAVALQLISLVEGWGVIREKTPHACAPLRYWTLLFCAAAPCVTLSSGSPLMLPVVVMLVVGGDLVRDHVPHSCEHTAHHSWTFVGVASARGAGAAACAAFATLIMAFLRIRWAEFERLFGTEGQACQAVIRQVLDSRAPVVDGDTECCICLGEGPAADAAGDANDAWRELPCGHRFHQRCLVEWLKRRPRCPLCRIDLCAAYEEP